MTRFGFVMLTYATTVGVTLSAFVHLPKKLIWNASASVPIGLYEIASADRLAVSDLVAIRAPEPLGRFLADRGYLPLGVPLMKRILALPGQQVCRAGHTVTVDGIAEGEALARDSQGQSLPVWQGCCVIAEGEVFVMNRSVRDSLDGRYFGPVSASLIIGRAIPLWTNDANVGRSASSMSTP
ncbi:hypothetical protein LMIY3S_00027 [Labrys miyagiensis]